jgi:hypothetical protein
MPKQALTFCLLLLVCAVALIHAQQPATPLHVLRIAAGPGGVEEKGTFRLTEERIVFSRTDDREVIVFFQWEGVPGRHLLEATWRSPDGSTSSKSTINYDARERRFGAYWRFVITPDTSLGMWSIDATVDGQPGGRFTFEITGAPAPAAPTIKRPNTQQELHDLLSRHFAVLIRKGPGMRELEPAMGTVAVPGQIFTAVAPLDSIDQLTIVRSDGTAELTSVVDVNRERGWAIVEAPTGDVAALTHAKDPRVGDGAFSMVGSGGSRVLLEGQITGTLGSSTQPEGWTVSFVNGLGVDGAPVVNEFGEWIGMIGGKPRDAAAGFRSFTSSTVDLGNVPVIPLRSIAPRAGSRPATFADVRARGLLLEPLVLEEHIVSGGFSKETPRGTLPPPQIQRDEFSHADKEMVVFVTWGPRTRLKGQAAFHLYNSANVRVASSKPAKADFRAKDLATSLWRIPVIMPAGVYRAELHFDEKPVWRRYLRINP